MDPSERVNINHWTIHEEEVEVTLRPTISWPVSHDQIFAFCLTIAGFLLWGALSNEKMGL
jgi:hypothetical protein